MRLNADRINLLACVQLVWRSGRESDWYTPIVRRVTPYYHLIFPRQNGFVYGIGTDTPAAVPAGDAILVPPWTTHTFDRAARTGPRLLWGDFQLLVHGAVDVQSFVELPVRWKREQATALMAALRALVRAVSEEGASPGTLYRAQAEFVASLMSRATWRPDIALRLSNLNRVAAVLREIRHHPERQWSRDALAKMAFLAPTRLTELFRAATDMTPVRFVESLRIERIKERLLETDDKLERLAEEFRFCDAFHLSKRFKRWTGMSPLAYRREFRANWNKP